jgi:hypothetical protein
MKHIKTYEAIRLKNIEVGRIYYIGSWLHDYKSSIPFAKVIHHDEDKWILTMKTYIKSTKEEVKFETSRKNILRLATPEEIEEFEYYENIEKFNL